MTTNDDRPVYYGIAIEYDYPSETNYVLRENTFDSFEEVLQECHNICDKEYEFFCNLCGDGLKPPSECLDENGNIVGVIITCKNGLDSWWFLTRILKIPFGLSIPENKKELKND